MIITKIILILLLLISISMIIYKYTITTKSNYLKPKPNKFSILDFYSSFKTILNILKEINIPYAFCYGTALGFYRSNDFIPHDDDIDIMIKHSDLSKLGFQTIQQQQKYINNIATKYGLQGKYSTPHKGTPFLYTKNGKGMPILYQYMDTKTGLGIDFYVFYEDNDNNLWLFSEGGEYDYTGYKFSNTIGNYKKINIHGIEISVCPIQMIIEEYGPNFMTPMKRDDPNYHSKQKEYYGEFPDKWLLPLI